MYNEKKSARRTNFLLLLLCTESVPLNFNRKPANMILQSPKIIFVSEAEGTGLDSCNFKTGRHILSLRSGLGGLAL